MSTGSGGVPFRRCLDLLKLEHCPTTVRMYVCSYPYTQRGTPYIHGCLNIEQLDVDSIIRSSDRLIE